MTNILSIADLLLRIIPFFRMASQSEHASTRRGALIVVEGLDRAGKSSQCEMLRDYLSSQGKNVKYIRFPGLYDCQ